MTYGNSVTFCLLTVFVNSQICLRKLNQQSSFQKDSAQPIQCFRKPAPRVCVKCTIIVKEIFA